MAEREREAARLDLAAGIAERDALAAQLEEGQKQHNAATAGGRAANTAAQSAAERLATAQCDVGVLRSEMERLRSTASTSVAAGSAATAGATSSADDTALSSGPRGCTTSSAPTPDAERARRAAASRASAIVAVELARRLEATEESLAAAEARGAALAREAEMARASAAGARGRAAALQRDLDQAREETALAAATAATAAVPAEPASPPRVVYVRTGPATPVARALVRVSALAAENARLRARVEELKSAGLDGGDKAVDAEKRTAPRPSTSPAADADALVREARAMAAAAEAKRAALSRSIHEAAVALVPRGVAQLAGLEGVAGDASAIAAIREAVGRLREELGAARDKKDRAVAAAAAAEKRAAASSDAAANDAVKEAAVRAHAAALARAQRAEKRAADLADELRARGVACGPRAHRPRPATASTAVVSRVASGTDGRPLGAELAALRTAVREGRAQRDAVSRDRDALAAAVERLSAELAAALASAARAPPPGLATASAVPGRGRVTPRGSPMKPPAAVPRDLDSSKPAAGGASVLGGARALREADVRALRRALDERERDIERLGSRLHLLEAALTQAREAGRRAATELAEERARARAAGIDGASASAALAAAAADRNASVPRDQYEKLLKLARHHAALHKRYRGEVRARREAEGTLTPRIPGGDAGATPGGDNASGIGPGGGD